MATTEEVRVETMFLRPRDFTRYADHTFDLHEMLADRWRVTTATEEGFVFVRQYIAPTAEEVAAKDAKRAAVRAKYLSVPEVVATAPAIKPGDVVKLKSGGPSMTVGSVENGRAYCAWYADGTTRDAPFAVEALIAA